MNKTFASIFLIASALLVSCRNNNEYHLYNNKQQLADGNLQISYELNREYIPALSDDVDLSFYISFKNLGEKVLKVSPKSPTCIRETDNTEAKVNTSLLLSFELNKDEEKSILFATSLPTYTKTENYVFKLKINSKMLFYHFYNNPSNKTSFSSK
jgi:hypothetical protein